MKENMYYTVSVLKYISESTLMKIPGNKNPNLNIPLENIVTFLYLFISCIELFNLKILNET